MRSTRGPSGADSSRADAAARRLALLAADLGSIDPDLSLERLSPGGDHSGVGPARLGVPLVAADPVDAPARCEPPEPPEPPELPRPGRHAARRRPRWGANRVADVRLPGLEAPQLTVLAVIVAVGVAVTTWWVLRDQASTVEPVAAVPPASVEPLVSGSPSGLASPGSTVPVGDTVTVDVTGKVRRPGIVVLDTGARVVDALKAAGGERHGVDLSTLNLARVLVDGEQIVVGAARVSAPAAPTGSAPPGAPPTLVNLNTATQAELETLPEVGPVTALAIMAWRDEHGGFTSVDELLEVDGIGEVTLEKLAPYITV